MKRLEKIIKKYSNWFKKIFVFLCIFIVITEVKSFKKVIISIITFIENNISKNISENSLRVVYTYFREIAIILVFILSIIFILYALVRPILERISKKKVNGNFEESLTKYLDIKNELHDKKGYLVTGEWGSGKSYIVNRFFDDHYKFSKRPIYRVSCFGLDTREAVINEIEKQIEINDNSLLNWTQYIPIIGLPIFSLLKKSYSLENISSDAIFIFDDFERITPIGIDGNTTKIHYDRADVAMGLKYFSTEAENPDFKEVNREFEKIQKSFNELSDERNKIVLSSNLQKYNVVTGLINELIEKNNSKVIIICNTDSIGNNYMDKIFRGKLDCITYNKFANNLIISNIFDKTLMNYIFVDENSEEIIKAIMPEILKDFDTIWIDYNNSNLRDIKSFFQAFLETLNIIEPYKKIDKELLVSLFYSIYFVKISGFNLNIMNKIPIGASLLYNLKVYREHNDYLIFRHSKLAKEAKWFGTFLSSYWILNLSRPNNIDDILLEFENYKYIEVENLILDNKKLAKSDYSMPQFSMEHIIYLIKLDKQRNMNNGERILIKEFKKTLSEWLSSGINQEIPNHVKLLKSMNDNKLLRHPNLESWFALIYESTNYKAKDGFNNNMFMEYRSFLQKYGEFK